MDRESFINKKLINILIELYEVYNNDNNKIIAFFELNLFEIITENSKNILNILQSWQISSFGNKSIQLSFYFFTQVLQKYKITSLSINKIQIMILIKTLHFHDYDRLKKKPNFTYLFCKWH